ncbi:phosphoribosylglycinamide formyltransferase [Oceaniradius stylonematis]|uniref:phosphoribosylglycinamide formyltransferase n=1 Tax=Oceaniradius stylonematis TaxID=2184161 RepID=UPI00273E88C7|nr:phosphoribosylglycinamide formyltransferase [Oceaniradius stylonematis]
MSQVGKRRVAVLISGRGSNMEALADACAADDYPATIAGVLSDRADAGGLATAARRGIATAALPRADFADKAAHEAAIGDQLRAWDTEFVCLAGFMRLLSADFLAPWQGRIVNIHPSLLPRHKGLDTHARALAAGDSEHGCSVHHVTAGMDEGPVIAQARVPVLPGDTADTLAARVLVEEHRLYPEALKMLIGQTAR